MYSTYSSPKRSISVKITISSFNQDTLIKKFRFTGSQVREMIGMLQLNRSFLLDNGSTVDGEEILLVTLRRLVYPARLFDLEEILLKSESMLSIMFNVSIQYLCDKFGDKLKSLRQWVLHLAHLEDQSVRKELR